MTLYLSAIIHVFFRVNAYIIYFVANSIFTSYNVCITNSVSPFLSEITWMQFSKSIWLSSRYIFQTAFHYIPSYCYSWQRIHDVVIMILYSVNSPCLNVYILYVFSDQKNKIDTHGHLSCKLWNKKLMCVIKSNV